MTEEWIGLLIIVLFLSTLLASLWRPLSQTEKDQHRDR